MPNASDNGGDHAATRACHGEGGDSINSVGSVDSVVSQGSVDSVVSVVSVVSRGSTASNSSGAGRQSVTPTTPASKSPAARPAKPLDAHRSLKPPLIPTAPMTPMTPMTPASPPFARSYDRPLPSLDLSRGLNLHALGISTSPLGPLERRISFASNSEADSGRGELERFRDYGGRGAGDTAYTSASSDFGLVEESEPDHDLGPGPGLDQDYDFEYSYDDGTGDFDASVAEDHKDVLIDRLQDVVRHVSSYTPSSPSHSARSRSAATSAQSSPLRDKEVATPARSKSMAAATTTTTTPASRSLMAVTTPAKRTPVVYGARAAAAAVDTPTPRRPAAPFNTPDENVMSALHAHIDEMEAVLAAAMAAEAVANAAAAASPRNRHNQHDRHYPWQRSSERRLRPTAMSMSMSGMGLDGSSDRADDRADDRISGSAQSSPKKRRGPYLEAAPVLIRNQSAPPRVSTLGAEWMGRAERRERTVDMTEMAEVPEVPEAEDSPEEEEDSPEEDETPADAAAPEQTGDDDDATKDGTVVDANVIGDCEALADDLSTVLASLMRRSQEADAIQQALLAQLDAANQRNAELEAQVKQLEERAQAEAEADEGEEGEDGRLDDMDSELSFLRLQLRAIEVQCRSHIPKGADPELTESIENWKADWAALRGRVGDERRSTVTLGGDRQHSTRDRDGHGAYIYDRSNSTF